MNHFCLNVTARIPWEQNGKRGDIDLSTIKIILTSVYLLARQDSHFQLSLGRVL